MSVEATVATWRLSKKQVSAPEKLFLLSCANRAGESHECWPSIKRLCVDTGLDRKTVIKVRQSVIDKSLLQYTGSFLGRSGQIPVMRLNYVDQSESEFTSTESTTSPKNGTGTSPKNGTGDQSQKRDTESKRENLKEEPKNTPYIPNTISEEMGECDDKNLSSRSKGTIPRQIGVVPRSMKGIDSPGVRFEEFWNLYPVKVAKETCLKKWKQSNLDSIADSIIQKVDLQILNDYRWMKGFVPNPLTYIIQERWKDELDTRVRGSTAKQQSTDSFHNTMDKYKKAPTDGYYDEHGKFTANYL